MKKVTQFLMVMAMFLALLSPNAFSQTYIEIGNGTTYGTSPGYYGPWGNYWENCHTQQLYLASELGAPTGKKFTDLAWNFERVSSGTNNHLNNVTIRIKETTLTSLPSGAYIDMTGATQVFYASSFTPTTTTGWKVIDITDYIWTGTNNIIIDVLWGDNGYWNSTYYRTYKTNAGYNRTIIGYADSETPPNYDGVSTYYDNMRFYWIPLIPPGNIEGYVFNYDGLSISGATVAVNGGPSTVTNAAGYYYLGNVNGGPQTVYCYKEGYNGITTSLQVISNQTIQHNFTLTQPSMVVNPLYVEQTLNPNEYYTFSMNVLNNGTGPLHWESTINMLTMPILPCEYSIALYDTYGDGWNGGTLDVLVNGVVVLDNITLSSGSGPAWYYFTVISGDMITTQFTAGSWAGEPYYYIYNSAGDQVWYSPPASAGPPNITAGQLYASCSGGSWLTMDDYSGDVPGFGGVDNIPTHMDAANTTAGEIYTGEIVFTSTPNVGTITVPVTMIISGPALQSPENLEATLVNDITGQVSLTWTFAGDVFQFFLIKRDGVIIGTTTNTNYLDILPDFGTYCYTVQAVYDEGATSPAGPACVEWPNPEIFVNPMALEGWVWVDHQVTVYTTITNTGVGTLYYEFPDFIGTMTNDTRAYCAGSGGCDEYISKVEFNTINQSSGCSGYANYTNVSTEVEADETYQIKVTVGNLYSGDIVGVWVDWDQDEEFDEALVQLTGSGSLYTGNITVPEDAEGGPTRMRVRLQYYGTLQPCGTTSYGEVEDYTLDVQSGFIIAVEPNFGTIASGESQVVAITYSAEGYEPGDYTEDLILNSNDQDEPEVIIANTMHVYMPGQFAGMVHDNDDGSPLNGVTVTAGPFQTTTNEDGNYSLYVDQGTYDVVFQKVGYMTVTVADTFALAGIVTPINIGMWDANYAPGMVHAEVMDNDVWCEITWTLPEGPYEITYDDGEADDYFIFASAGGMNAVKFTPSGYPATVIGGQFYVGDGSFPGPFIGTQFGVAIFDDDGANGLPGTMLDSNGVTVNNYGWVSLDWMNATIEDGSFYLAMIQVGSNPNAAPIGVDTDNPTYFRSYIFIPGAPSWSLSPMQDLMIRAWVSGPEGDMMANNAKGEWKATPKVPATWTKYAATASGTLPKILPGYERNDARIRPVMGMANRDVTNYRVARYSNFDPNGSPAAGTLTELATTTNQFYNDYAWAGLPMGWYAYGVKALYTSGLYSNYTISNIVGHLMDYQVTVNVTLSTGLEPSNVEVTLKAREYPYEDFFAVTPASGTVVFDMVWRGHYDVCAFKIGYDEYCIENAFINSDKVYNIMLSEKKYPPTCLVVDPVSLEATWCEPLRTAIDEDFEDAVFPPAGWQILSQGEGGWVRTDDGSSGSWTIPTWDSYYAVANDDAAGSDNDGCCDYLITPPCDMRESEGYVLSFNSYYDGLYGQLAFVEYSIDGGATWEVLSQMMPGTSWTDQEIDLAAFSGLAGPANVWFAFHADDAGEYASGWAIDNVLVQVPAPAANYIDFWVFLDNAFKGVTTETNWNYAPLWYGQTYTASVAARYTSGLSAKDYYTFFCEYLFPPDSLEGFAPDDAAILTWWPPLEYWPVMATAGNGPQYSKSEINFIAGEVANKEAISRQGAEDVILSETGTRDIGDVVLSFPWTGGGLCWGICDDTENLWISDPNVSATVIYEVDYEGTVTGNTITISQGQSWVGDMVSDGEFLYGCLVGGPNSIVKVDLATGETVGTIGGDFTVTSQRGLAADFINEEFYIGGWNSNQIWRTDWEGTTISTFGFSGVSGLAWHPNGGPDNGALWVVVNAATDNVTEVDPNNGWATIQAFVMPNDQGYSGAGMEIKNSGEYAGYLWIPNQSDNTVYLVEAENLEVGPVAGLPENILGYNVYRDMEFVAYTAHTPEEEYVMQGYVDENLDPGIYMYSVTAVYDLARYGFPGETGESMHEGPAEVVVDYCFELEFMETWSLGNFDDNNWLTDGSNWSINGQEGNPEPVAEFTWDPILTNYAVSMESFPLCAQGMTEGRIYLDFDLKLESVQPTGMEMLHVQVWNWDSKIWSTVATYSNVDGSFDWMSEHLDIKSQAMNKVFKIRFHAMGANSIDILSWFVDNIHVYRACEGVTDLTAAADYNQGGIELNWVGPDLDIVDEWIHWDDGVFSGTSIGTGEAVQFDVAHRWEPAQMTEWEGASVTEIAFVPAEANCAYYVRVWIGAGAANLVADQMVPSPVIGEWNYVTLATPVPIDITQELYIGYYVDAQTGYPAGCDDGPAIDGYGNMMNFGGWQTLLQINPELDYNWNIAGHLQTVTGAVMPMSKTVTPSAINGQSLVMSPVQMNQKVFAPANGGRDLSGYNIYRSKDGGEYAQIDFVPGTELTYLDTSEDLEYLSTYCYMVTAVWAGETGDVCESAFSAVDCDLWNNVGINEGANGSFGLYPNPADDHVFITTTDELKRVTVYNALGQLVVDEITTGKQYELATASYTIGVYMVRVETAAGVTTRTLTIQR
ncbi:MAG: carboxypeptidase regulatory-like domain-containing protein [Bacteroidales bacterium]|nr:carboxypeptidase regulatory-like domain-containing protein [Bacteroidales bacterium]